MNALLEARRLLCQLGLGGHHFNSDLFLERLESRLGIAVAAIPDPRLPAGGISGARITTNGSHVVFYPAGVSDRLQLAVICHECAHLLLDHRGRPVDDVLTGPTRRCPTTNSPLNPLGPPSVTSQISPSGCGRSCRAPIHLEPKTPRRPFGPAFAPTIKRTTSSDSPTRWLRKRGLTRPDAEHFRAMALPTAGPGNSATAKLPPSSSAKSPIVPVDLKNVGNGVDVDPSPPPAPPCGDSPIRRVVSRPRRIR